MSTRLPDDQPRPRREALEGASSDAAPAIEGDAPALAALVLQREAFRRDVRRIEATLAQGREIDSGLYERLLRSRRISRKLANRISVARLQERMCTGT